MYINGSDNKQSIFYMAKQQIAGLSRISLFMNDVHYYLAGYKPAFNCVMYITGCDFYPIPGFYALPAGEGNYTLSARPDFSAHISMKT